MGADLFESYVGSVISAITLGLVYYSAEGALYPLVLAAVGILASIIGTFFVKGDENANPHKALKTGSYTAAILVAIVSVILSKTCFGNMKGCHRSYRRSDRWSDYRYHHRNLHLR